VADVETERYRERLIMDINADELRGVCADLARIIGMDRLLALCEVFGGTNVYVPRKERILLKARNDEIKREFVGNNYGRLANKYGLSERRVRQIVDEDRPHNRQK
jgi:Mor family transcriptional regulator